MGNKPGAKRFLKQMILWAGYYLGIFELCRIFFSRKGRTPILVYHHILDQVERYGQKSSFCLKGTGISRQQFEEQIKYLKKKFKIISLKEYCRRREKKEDLKNAVVLTFDDGFKDAGLEVLVKHSVPATIFLIGSAFEKTFWRHKIFLMLDEVDLKLVDWRSIFPESRESGRGKPGGKEDILNGLLNMAQSRPPDQRETFLEALAKNLGVKNKFLPQDIYVSRGDVKKLISKGLSFGAHSMAHADMTRLSDEDCKLEIEASQKLLVDLTGDHDVAFAIPFGRFNEKILGILKEKLYLCNVTSSDGFNGPDEDLYCLKRINACAQTIEDFVFKVSGAESLLRRMFFKD